MKFSLVFSIIFLFVFSTFSNDFDVPERADSSEKIFRPAQIIVPAALITAGAIIMADGRLDNRIEDAMAPRRTGPYNFDSFLQYAPHLSLYGFSLFGVEAKHSYGERTLLLTTSGLFVLTAVATKHIVKHPRPNTGTKNAWPSGHTTTAFWGAELVRREYPVWCGVIAYTAATTVGFMRIYNGRHWFGDVVAGAGWGILSVNAAYWLLPAMRNILPSSRRENADSPQSVSISPYFDGNNAGLFLTISL